MRDGDRGCHVGGQSALRLRLACLKDHGAQVSWERPFQTQRAEEIAQQVVVRLIVAGSTQSASATAHAGIAKFKTRFAGGARPSLRNQEGPPSTQAPEVGRLLELPMSREPA